MNEIHALASEPWVARLGWTLIHFVWEGAAIAAAYAIVRSWISPRLPSSRARYALACVAMMVMVTAPLATYYMDGKDVAHQFRPSASRVVGSFAVVPSDIAATDIPVIAVSPEPRSARALSWIVAVWFVGTVAFWFRLAGGWIIAARMRSAFIHPAPPEWSDRLARLCRGMGVSRRVRMLVSSFVRVPTVIGCLRPVILLPLGFLAGSSQTRSRPY